MRMIYLIRHGEPQGRKEHRCVSQEEECLGAVGKEQAGYLAKWLEQYLVTAVISSPQKRCLETAACFMGGAEQVQINANLQEISVGEWDGRSFEEIKEKWPKLYEMRGLYPGTTVPPGGESFCQAGERLERALFEILNTISGTVAVCTHAGILRGWLYQKMQIPETELFSIDIPFGSITEVWWDGTDFLVKGVGKKPNTVPGPEEIQSLFQKAGTPQNVQAHGYRVAEAARKLAKRQIETGEIR